MQKLNWDSSPPATLACRGRNLVFAAPRQHWFAGDQMLARPSSPSSSFGGPARICKTLRTKGNGRTGGKDADSTSKLGVSNCQALSTLTKDETRLSMHAKT